jgi:hypothetical protein
MQPPSSGSKNKPSRKINLKEVASTQQAGGSAFHLPHAGSLLGLFFDTEDGGHIFLRNVGRFSTDYTGLYPRMYNSSLMYSYIGKLPKNLHVPLEDR